MLRGTLTRIVNFAHALGGAVFLTAVLSSTAFAQSSPARSESRARRATPAQTTRPSSSSSHQSNRTQARDSQTPRDLRDDSSADLSITAHVTADSLRFEKVPNPRVEFTGRPKRETVWEAERENLPPEVQPGVTYRNIGITLRITSVFADIDRIVAEALGEVPTSDDAQPVPAQPSPTPPSQPEAALSPNPSSITSNASTLQASTATKLSRRRLTRRGRAK
jgi:hypothetical protein